MLSLDFRLPSQDVLCPALHVLMSAGLLVRFLLSARPALVLLPVAPAASMIPDAIVFVLPSPSAAIVVTCLPRLGGRRSSCYGLPPFIEGGRRSRQPAGL